MLCKANIDCLDGRPERFHDGKDESIAKDKGQEHVKKDSRVVYFWMILVPLMHQHRPRKHHNDARNGATDARTHVGGNVFVNHAFDA